MARKVKIGLDYFPHSCDHDDELKYIIALHKDTGYYVYFRLLEKIYKNLGYYIEWEKKNIALFSDEINIEIPKIITILNDCIEEKLFDKNIFNKYNVITSKGIQERYFEAIERRKHSCVIKEYILLKDDYINEINVNINWLNVDKSTQSKVNKTKVDYKKVLLSELENNSDFPQKEYLDITIAFWRLFIENLKEKEISTARIEKANGKWIDNIRLLIETDKYNLDDLREVFKFLQVNEFWKTNILSTSKLREKFEKLLLNARKDETRVTKEGCTARELAEVIGKHFATD